MVIDGNVFRALYKHNIIKFIQDKGIDVEKKLQEYSIDNSENGYELSLIDKLVEHRFLKISEVEEFLSEELNYGRSKNIYIEMIKKIRVMDVKETIEIINSFTDYNYSDSEKVNDKFYRGEIRKFIELGEKKLIESTIIENNGKVEKIKLLFGEGISLLNGKHSNNYYSIDIDIANNILSLRIINWSNKVNKSYWPDNRYREIIDLIKKQFKIVSHKSQVKIQKLVYKLVNDLNNKVLETTKEEVDNKLESHVRKSVEKWGNIIVSPYGKKFEKSENEIITQLILNNFYRIRMYSKHRKITASVLKESYNVQAYVRQVKFLDDTVGEGKARSSDTKESVLDTSVFYDIKARLDKQKNIKNTIVYWMNCKNHEDFATSIHIDSQNKFKIVFYPKSIDREMVDYVLGEIKEYNV